MDGLQLVALLGCNALWLCLWVPHRHNPLVIPCAATCVKYCGFRVRVNVTFRVGGPTYCNHPPTPECQCTCPAPGLGQHGHGWGE